jgi:segregation and condensation protein A
VHIARALMNIGERRQNVLGLVQRRGRLTFVSLIADCHTRFEAIVTFLAVLELLKTEELWAEQSAVFGDIVLRHAGHSPDTAATA